MINTCGWVTGLGKSISKDLFEAIRPPVVVSMNKSLKTENSLNNEFVSYIVQVQKEQALANSESAVLDLYNRTLLLSVVNDSFEAVNVKGSLNRNRTLLACLLHDSSLTTSFSSAFRLQTLQPILLPFSQFAFSLTEAAATWKLNLQNKIEFLSNFNAQIVALLKVPQLPTVSTIGNVTATELSFEGLEAEIVCFALVRDIDPSAGILVIPTIEIDEKSEMSQLAEVNCVHLVDNKIFSFSSAYLLQPDFEELLLRRGIQDDIHGALDRFLLTDLKAN